MGRDFKQSPPFLVRASDGSFRPREKKALPLPPLTAPTSTPESKLTLPENETISNQPRHVDGADTNSSSSDRKEISQ